MATLGYPKKPWLFGGPTLGRVRGRGPRSGRGRTQCDGRKNDAGYFCNSYKALTVRIFGTMRSPSLS